MLRLLLFLLSLFVNVYGSNHCQQTQALPLTSGDYVVRFNDQPCTEHFNYSDSHTFCENSGWGDEEATVVCRSELHSRYGISGYVSLIHPSEIGFTHVNCTGNENSLEECTVERRNMLHCSQAGIVRQCLNVSQILVSRTTDYELFEHVEVLESESVRFCVIVWGPLTEYLHVLVKSVDSALALSGYDYHPLNQLITFEPTDSLRSEQCLEIDIIDDSLPESWEMFSVLLSTNSTDVIVTRQFFNVFIHPNNGSCTEGGVSLVSDVNNSSLQLVEMCSSEGVWSPVCDTSWTIQDATVVCRELGDSDSYEVTYNTLERAVLSDSLVMIECNGTEMTLSSCPQQTIHSNTHCQLLFIHCEGNDNEDEETPVITSSSGDNNDDDSDGDGDMGESGEGDSSHDSDSGESSESDPGDSESGESDPGDSESGENDNDDSEFDEDGSGGGDGDHDSDSDKGGSGESDNGDSDSDGSGDSNEPPTTLPPETTTDDDDLNITISTIDEVKPTPVDDEYISIDVIAGVAGAILICIILLILTAVVIVYMKHRNRQTKAAWIEGTTETSKDIETSVNGRKGEKHLDNPTYDEGTDHPPLESSHRNDDNDEVVEHNLVNPLYNMTMSTESDEQDNGSQLYAVLECPSYEVLDKVVIPAVPTPYETVSNVNPGPDTAANTNDTSEYDYVDISNTQ